MKNSACWVWLALALALTGCDSNKSKPSTDDESEEDDKPSKRSKKPTGSSTASASNAVTIAPGTPPETKPTLVPVEAGPPPSFKLGATSFKLNETISLTFDRPLVAPEGQQYWITLVDPNAPDTTYGAWHYLKSAVTEDKLVAAELGDFEVRFYDLHPQTKYKVLTRQRISIVECRQVSDCPGSGPLCEAGRCVGAGSSPVPIEPVEDGELGPDGWPVIIPPVGSKAPSVAEWQAVPKEVTVRGSGALKCETKMLREWLRINCKANSMGVPVAMEHNPAYGQQAFKFVAEGSVASAVLQMIPTKNYSADFTWASVDLGSTTYTVTISWNNGRPIGAFNLPGAM